MKLKIAFGKSEKSNIVENKTINWLKLTGVLAAPKVRAGTRSYMLAGQCPSGVRGSKHGDAIVETSLLMIDLDNDEGGLSWGELVFELEMSLSFCWAAYTTRSYTGENVRYRIIIPFAAPIGRAYHASVVRHVMQLLPDGWGELFDACSERPDQAIFLPCTRDADAPFFAANGGDEVFNPDHIKLVYGANDDAGAFGDLESAIMAEPADLTTEQVRAYLDALDPNTITYGGDEGVFGWVDVGMALAHQYKKSDAGFDLWVSWSARCESKHREGGMRAKWNSFDVLPKGRRPLTFASVIAAVRDRGGLMATSEDGRGGLSELLNEAGGVDSLASYEAFKSKISAINTTLLPKDGRTMIAARVADNFGKEYGLTKTVIVRELAPKKSATGEDDRALPSWAKGWCYIEKTREFYHLKTDVAIPRESIQARYDRKAECLHDEKRADYMMLVTYKIPTVVDMMFWPGEEPVFKRDGKKYVNIFVDDGARSDGITNEGREAVDAMLAHVGMLVSDERENTIILDWLTYVFQNPGKRVNWSLMVQGAQGIGKSYIGVMMQHIMGRNVRQLDPMAIAGRFTGWAHGSTLAIIEEMRIRGADKYEIVDRMKPFITNETVQIEEKGRDHRTVPNFTNYLIFTNHKDALPVSEGDRRYCVIYSDVQNEQDLFETLGGADAAGDYFDRLFSLTSKHAGSIAAYFRDRDVSENFKPHGRAPETRALKTIMRFSVSPEADQVSDAIEMFSEGCAAICSEYVDITHLQYLADGEGVELPKTRTLSAILQSMGFEPIERVWVKRLGKRHTVWIQPRKISSFDATTRVQDFHNREETDENEIARVSKSFDPDDVSF